VGLVRGLKRVYENGAGKRREEQEFFKPWFLVSQISSTIREQIELISQNHNPRTKTEIERLKNVALDCSTLLAAAEKSLASIFEELDGLEDAVRAIQHRLNMKFEREAEADISTQSSTEGSLVRRLGMRGGGLLRGGGWRGLLRRGWREV
jgi:hypothetical protein